MRDLKSLGFFQSAPRHPAKEKERDMTCHEMHYFTVCFHHTDRCTHAGQWYGSAYIGHLRLSVAVTLTGHKISTGQEPNAGKMCKWLVKFEYTQAIWPMDKKVNFAHCVKLIHSLNYCYFYNSEAALSDADLSLNQRATDAVLQKSSLYKVGKY